MDCDRCHYESDDLVSFALAKDNDLVFGAMWDLCDTCEAELLRALSLAGFLYDDAANELRRPDREVPA